MIAHSYYITFHRINPKHVFCLVQTSHRYLKQWLQKILLHKSLDTLHKKIILVPWNWLGSRQIVYTLSESELVPMWIHTHLCLKCYLETMYKG